MNQHAQAMHSTRVLVTGASGFLGAAVCRLLHSRGAEVHGVSRQPRADASSAPSVARWWHCPLGELEFTRRLLSEIRPAYVFHLAGAVTGVRDLAAVLPTFEGNLAATVNLLTAAAEQSAPPRFVMAGSLEEPDDASQPPSSPYAASKLAAWQYARMFQWLYGLSVVVPRVFIVYGPGQEDPKKLIPYVVTSLLRNESPKLSSGTREIDWIYVDDAAEGLLAAAHARDVTERVDLGSGQLVTTRGLVERLAALVPSAGKPLFGALPDRPMEQVRVADVAKTTRLIGWSPRTPLDGGLRRTVDWLTARVK
jgi:UDP-glucose 4-epimerase